MTELYERTYGEGTVWVGSPLQMLNCRVNGIGYTAKPVIREYPPGLQDSSSSLKMRRQVYIEDGWSELPIYERGKLEPNMVIDGPGIVEAVDTTIYIPVGRALTVDKYKNCTIDVK